MTSFKIFRQSQDCVKSVFVYPNVLRPPPSPEMEQHCLQLSVFPMRDYNCTPNGHRDGKVRHMLVALRLHRDKEIKERNKQRKRANYSIFPYELIVKWDRYQHNKTCIIPILILVCVAGQTGLVSFITARFITQFIIFPPAKTIHKHGPFHQSMLDADLLKTAGRENSFGCTRTKKKKQHTSLHWKTKVRVCWSDSTCHCRNEGQDENKSQASKFWMRYCNPTL